MTGSHANASSGVISPSTHARPAWCESRYETGMFSFPACANSGQYSATRASTSSLPSCASLLAQIAVTPFVVENTSASVSSFHGAPVSALATPPQRSTTFSPRWYAANDAPTSSPLSKFAANAARTFSKPGAVEPWMSAMRSYSRGRRLRGHESPAARRPRDGGVRARRVQQRRDDRRGPHRVRADNIEQGPGAIDADDGGADRCVARFRRARIVRAQRPDRDVVPVRRLLRDGARGRARRVAA